MARIADTMTWADYEAPLRAALEVPSGEDDYLEALLDAAASAADTFIDRDWLDDDGADIALPARVVQGVYEWARVVRSARPQATSGQPANVKQVKVGDNQVTYQTAAERVTTEELALSAARLFWWGAKKNKAR